jgi:hypothetical protein
MAHTRVAGVCLAYDIGGKGADSSDGLFIGGVRCEGRHFQRGMGVGRKAVAEI